MVRDHPGYDQHPRHPLIKVWSSLNIECIHRAGHRTYVLVKIYISYPFLILHAPPCDLTVIQTFVKEIILQEESEPSIRR